MNEEKIPHSILVMGIGELGFEVLKHLSEHQDDKEPTIIHALVRPSASQNPEREGKLERLASMGIQTVTGDVTSASMDSLASLLAPYDTVICCIGFSSGPGVQTRITRAVLKAGIKRYFPWQFGVDYDTIGRGSAQDVFDEQLDVRDLLRSQDKTQWVVVATGMFTSFLFEPAFGVVDLDHQTVHALGSWDNSVTVTTPEDIGKLTAIILFHTPPFTNETVYIAGDTLTYGALANELETQLKLPFKREVWSMQELTTALESDPNNNLLKYRAVFAAGVGVSWPLQETFNHSKGIKTTNVAEWIQQHLL